MDIGLFSIFFYKHCAVNNHVPSYIPYVQVELLDKFSELQLLCQSVHAFVI